MNTHKNNQGEHDTHTHHKIEYTCEMREIALIFTNSAFMHIKRFVEKSFECIRAYFLLLIFFLLSNITQLVF